MKSDLLIIIPAYNEEENIENVVSFIQKKYSEYDYIVVNDGSKDNTSKIGHEYAEKYPDIIRVIDKENGGHGDAVNYGLANAEGKYFKVVDSDDWVNTESLQNILNVLKKMEEHGEEVDMLIANYVYEKEGAHHKKVMHYTNLPQNQIFTWNDVSRFRKGQYILMHSVIYRTKLLRECGLELPKHTFYVDNIYVYKPLPSVKTLYYMDVDFYRYFIGREDQSVNEKVMISRIDQQINVNKIMVDEFDLWKIPNRKLRHYMFNYLEIITVISTIMLIRSGTEENLLKKRELWKYIKDHDIRLFHHLRAGIMGNAMNLPGKGGRKISVAAYRLSQKVVGFN